MPERKRPWGNKLLINTLLEVAESVGPYELVNIHLWGGSGMTIRRYPLPMWWPEIVIMDADRKAQAVELLNGKNLSQIAREIGMSAEHLRSIRRGVRGFSDRTAQRILDHFGL